MAVEEAEGATVRSSRRSRPRRRRRSLRSRLGVRCGGGCCCGGGAKGRGALAEEGGGGEALPQRRPRCEPGCERARVSARPLPAPRILRQCTVDPGRNGRACASGATSHQRRCVYAQGRARSRTATRPQRARPRTHLLAGVEEGALRDDGRRREEHRRVVDLTHNALLRTGQGKHARSVKSARAHAQAHALHARTHTNIFQAERPFFSRACARVYK